ncbi:MAG: type 1 glutamine amidotransferase [Bifidobacteriaceae bacterium]|jgi:GMP synthase-like glutamine amidotransferase|nr:type 1 glutamine amidotransferase [Bifidobacteriaceae bacterium]
MSHTAPDQPFVLILEHDSGDPPGLVGECLVQAGLPVQQFNVVHQPAPDLPDPSRLAALVVLGGLMNTDQTDHYPGLLAEQKLIQAAYQRNIPILGICLGHQLLAQALGGQVVHTGSMEIGFQRGELTAAGQKDAVLSGFGATPVLQWHGDNAIAPPDAAVLARNAFSACQAFRLGSALGVQFHLEVGPSQLLTWWRSEQTRASWQQYGQGDLLSQAVAVFPLLESQARAALRAWVATISPAFIR